METVQACFERSSAEFAAGTAKEPRTTPAEVPVNLEPSNQASAKRAREGSIDASHPVFPAIVR